MSDQVTFRQLTIESFRGFRDQQVLPLDASVVILTGPNGTGKTSVFDALLWGLSGRIPRLEALRARKNVEHIVNQYSDAGPAVVEIQFVSGTSNVVLRRSGTHQETLLELRVDEDVLRGSAAEARLSSILGLGDTLSMERLLSGAGLLQQDLMRSVLEAKPADRYAELNSLLGFTQLEEFEHGAAARTNEIKSRVKALVSEIAESRARLTALQDDLETRRARIESLPATDLARQELAVAIRESQGLIRVELDPVDAASARQLTLEAQQLLERMASMRSEYRALQSALAQLESDNPEERAASLREEVSVVRSQLADLVAQLRAATRAAAEAAARLDLAGQLAALAIPLLTDSCPVCHQRIDKQAVETHLRSEEPSQEALSSLRAQELDLRSKRLEVASRLQDLEDQLGSLEGRAARRAEMIRQVADAEAFFMAVGSRAIVVTSTLILARELDETSFEEVEGRLRDLAAKASTLAIVLASADDAQTLDQVGADTDALRELVEDLESRIDHARQQELKWTDLLNAAKAGRLEVVKRRINQLRPLFTDIFLRLDPHPTFKILDLEQELYYSRGIALPIVEDPVANRRADPSIVLSSSQANIVALAYFLAMGWALADEAPPFVLLDDPLQSLDDVNVLGFSDLCRFLRRKRQLIISTHDRRIASLLERKLAPRVEDERTLVIEFKGWNRQGPDLLPRLVDPQLREGEELLVAT